ncbi:MAG TPA: DUF2147 domain-containing protein [Novosphingobium sp.]|nr:DUF2147 domain-containing protein [Novosphingobium sp.]
MLVAAACAATPAWSVEPEAVLGTWRTPVKRGVVAIQRCGASICGRIIGSDNIRTNPDLRDLNNKDRSKRGRRLKGLQILGGFSRDGGRWSGGTVYNPEDGGTYRGTITPLDRNRLKLKGCIIWPLCKTQTWTRIN